MAAREYLSNKRESDVERSTKDIRQDIAEKEEHISRTVEQIRERITEKVDWRGYVKGSPYWALGAAAGLGYLVSGMLRTRTSSVERIPDPIAEADRDSTDDVRAGAAGPSLITATLLGIAAKAASDWIKNATSTAAASSGTVPRPQTGRGSIFSPGADT
jgi:ElaB/YqjD/DUF883 family membrane-anchored ribosome-binding protein